MSVTVQFETAEQAERLLTLLASPGAELSESELEAVTGADKGHEYGELCTDEREHDVVPVEPPQYDPATGMRIWQCTRCGSLFYRDR